MSQLSLKTIKLGDSADESKNFLIKTPAVADGTLVIERGDGTDVLTIDAAGNIAFPQMSGFGTAPIIESGSNDNGSYTKFADGTMICRYDSGFSSVATTSAAGGVFVNAAETTGPLYPASFVEVPTTSTTVVGGDSVAGVRWAASGTTGASTTRWPPYRIVDTASGTGPTALYFLAIGRWK